jgi:cytochrome o ubiquinol oxidase subunit 2
MSMRHAIHHCLSLYRKCLLSAAALCVCGCSATGLGFLDPAGPVAYAQRELFGWVVGLSLVVVLPVILLTPVLVWRYRYARKDACYQPRWEFSLPMEILSWGVPVVVVVILGCLTWQRTQQLDPYRPLQSSAAPLQVQVIALDWAWLFVYPEQGVASLNELTIPSGRAVHLSLTSASVMQSLMIARLSGQIYAMAGMRTQQYLLADAPGQFIGRNTQFNGAGFQTQMFTARSVDGPGFDNWLASVRQSGQRLSCERYRQLSQPRQPAPAPQTLPAVQSFAAVPAGLFDWVVKSFHSASIAECGVALHEGSHG